MRQQFIGFIRKSIQNVLKYQQIFLIQPQDNLQHSATFLLDKMYIPIYICNYNLIVQKNLRILKLKLSNSSIILNEIRFPVIALFSISDPENAL